MKNRYFRKTKLTEDEFGHIVFLYISGSTASDAQKRLQDGWGLKISRQTISTTFLAVGEYIYFNFFRNDALAAFKQGYPGLKLPVFQWETMMLGQIWSHMLGNLAYPDVRKQNRAYPFEGTGIIEHLRERRKRLNGFPFESLASHVGQASIAMLPVADEEDVLVLKTNWVLHEMSKNPMDSLRTPREDSNKAELLEIIKDYKKQFAEHRQRKRKRR